MDGWSFDSELAESGASLGFAKAGDRLRGERRMLFVRGASIGEVDDMHRITVEAFSCDEAAAAQHVIVLMW